MRIPLATDLKTRTGVPDKDARLKNSYIETRGDQSVVRKRPIAQGGVSVGTGIAQGGINFNGLFLMNGDVLSPYTGGGTNWNSGTTYAIGDMVSLGFVDYWAINSNTNSQPPNANWSTTYVPAVPSLSSWTLGSITYPSYSGSHPIAYNGTRFVYLQGDPISGFAAPFTSTNGLTWTQQPFISGLAYTSYSINWNGSQFLAVGVAGVGIGYWATSVDGITWTVYNDGGTTPDFRDVAWNGSVYCAVNGSTGTSYTSANGIAWTAHATMPVADFRSITWNGSVFCAVGRLSSIAATSPDGITWTTQTLPYSTTWVSVTSMGSVICASGGNGTRIGTSSNNGVTWTGVIPSSPITNLVSSASLIIGVDTAASTSYSKSTDGITWTSSLFPTSKTWVFTGYGSGKGFVAMENIPSGTCAFSVTGL